MILWEEVGAECAEGASFRGILGTSEREKGAFLESPPPPGLFWCVYLALQAVMTGLVLRIWRVLEWSPEKCLLRITISLPWAWWVQLWRLLRYGCRNLSRNWTTNYKHVTEGSPTPFAHAKPLCSTTFIVFVRLQVTCRAVGIGSYLVRLSQRVIQVETASLILTGAGALNKVRNTRKRILTRKFRLFVLTHNSQRAESSSRHFIFHRGSGWDGAFNKFYSLASCKWFT